jgi:hypothetical protein
MTFNIKTFSIKGLWMTLSISHIQHKQFSVATLCLYAECHYVECRILFIIVLNAIMLSVIMLNVVVLSVVVPFKH